MRQDKLVGRVPGLRFGRQISPVLVRFAVGQDRITKGQKIDVQRPHSPALLPFATEPGLHRMQTGKECHRINRLLALYHRSRVHIVRPRPRRKAGRGKKPAKCAHRNAFL